MERMRPVQESWPSSEDKLEVHLTGRLHLSRYNREDAMEDNRTFVWSVSGMLSLREHVPVDISDWLDLINSDDVGNEYLIRYHIALMDPCRLLHPHVLQETNRVPVVPKAWHIHSCSSPDEALLGLEFPSPALHQLSDGVGVPPHSEPEWQDSADRIPPNLRGILRVIRNCAEHSARRFDRFMLISSMRTSVLLLCNFSGLCSVQDS